MQVDSNQVASWLQGLVVTAGMDRSHCIHMMGLWGGIQVRILTLVNLLVNCSLIIYLSAFPLRFINRVTQRELHKPSGSGSKGFVTAHGAVSFLGGHLLLVKGVV